MIDRENDKQTNKQTDTQTHIRLSVPVLPYILQVSRLPRLPPHHLLGTLFSLRRLLVLPLLKGISKLDAISFNRLALLN
jgi:hypothetical protein